MMSKPSDEKQRDPDQVDGVVMPPPNTETRSGYQRRQCSGCGEDLSFQEGDPCDACGDALEFSTRHYE